MIVQLYEKMKNVLFFCFPTPCFYTPRKLLLLWINEWDELRHLPDNKKLNTWHYNRIADNSHGTVVPNLVGFSTINLFFKLLRPTPWAPIKTSVFLWKGGILATSSYIWISWRSNSTLRSIQKIVNSQNFKKEKKNNKDFCYIWTDLLWI